MKNSRETPSKKSILGYFAKYPKILFFDGVSREFFILSLLAIYLSV